MKPNFKILDGLRGIAATYVLLNHARGNLLMGGNEYSQIKPVVNWSFPEKLYYTSLQLTTLGREFVILFFILSGFSIAYSLTNKTKISGFYLRRMIRLYPPFVTALIWAAVVFFIAKTFSPILTLNSFSVFDSFQSTALNLLYIPNGSFIGQFWSLAYEVIFYLLVPFLILNRRLYYATSIAACIISVGISWSDISGNNIPMIYILDYNIYFAVGIWLFHNYEVVSKKVLIKNKVLFYSIITLLFLSMVIIKFKTYPLNKITVFICVVMTILMIVYFIKNEVHNKVLAFLGNMSYTLYLTHHASLCFFKTFLLKFKIVDSILISTWYIWIIGVFVSIGISYIFYNIAEVPSKNLLTKMRYKLPITPESSLVLKT